MTISKWAPICTESLDTVDCEVGLNSEARTQRGEMSCQWILRTVRGIRCSARTE